MGETGRSSCNSCFLKNAPKIVKIIDFAFLLKMVYFIKKGILLKCVIFDDLLNFRLGVCPLEYVENMKNERFE